MRRIPQLDGLRGIAIGLVLLHHFNRQLHPSLPGWLSTLVLPIAELGWSGVDLFFILSGFLIGGILVDVRNSPNYYSTFYIRRGFRILPLYWLLVLLGFLFEAIGSHGGGPMGTFSLRPAPWQYYLTFTQNFYFGSHTEVVNYLQVTWSLAVEEQFYLTLPLLVRKIPREKLLVVTVAMVIFFCGLRSVLYGLGYINTMQAYVLPFCRFDSLFLGVVCALLMKEERLRKWLQNNFVVLLGATFVAGGAFFFMDHRLWTRNIFLHTAGFTTIGLFYACLMLLILIRPQGILARALSYRPLMLLGVVSYCVYLIHGSLVGIAEGVTRHLLGLSEIQLWGAAILGIAVTLLAAWGSWVFFESRLIEIGHRSAYERNKTLQPATNAS